MKPLSLSLLLLALFAVPGCGGSGSAVVPDVLDLFPHATSGTDRGQKGYVKLMAETKTHRLVLAEAGAELSFSGLELPGAVRFETELLLLDMPARSRKPLVAQLLGIDADGKETRTEVAVRTQLDQGRRWIPLEIDLAAPAPLRELRLTFRRDDFARRPGGRLALLRPRLSFERTRERATDRVPRQIVLITADTLRADVLGCYGNSVVKTPSIDRLAEESALFERAYATANVTNPSHTSIFTSLYLKDHGVVDNFTKLAPEVPTLLEPLRAAGFRSAAFVSSFNFQPEKSDFDKRFDEFYPCQVYFERRAEDVNLDAFPWLVEHADEDFFVWLHYFDAHMPYVPPYPYDRMYPREGEDEIELPIDYRGNLNWFSSTRSAGHYRAMYYGEVSYLDHHLGRLFDHLRALGIYDRATLVMTSDHGESLGEHGVYCDHATLFDEVTRVPLLIKQPAHLGFPGARRVEALVSGVDLYPTLFELYGLPLPPDLRGVSLVPWLRGLSGPESTAAHSTFARGIQEALRTRDHLVLLGVKSESLFPRFATEAGRRELFHVAADGELTDVTATDAERLEQLAAQLEAFLRDELDYRALPIDEAFIDEMGDLGYLQGDGDESSD